MSPPVRLPADPPTVPTPELAALLDWIAQLTAAAQRLREPGGRCAPPRRIGCEQPRSYLERAQVLYAQRRIRERAFGPLAAHFQEPAWDILLDLFIAYEQDRPISVSSACGGACVPATTGLRWLKVLERDGLVRCWPSAFDKRIRHAALTERAVQLMLAYFDRL